MNAVPNAVSDAAYEAGFEDARALVIGGLQRFAEGDGKNIPGSYLMGVFAMTVQATFENRAPGVAQIDVAAGLGGLMGDVLAQAAAEAGAEAPFARGGGQGLVNGLHGVVRAWAPRDDDGRSLVDASAVLDALAAAAAQYLGAVGQPRQRAAATAWFAEQLGGYIETIARGGQPIVRGR